MNSGCYTAMVTPFDGAAVDETGLSRLADFQIQNGITGLLAVGTTGESPTLAWQEHHRVVQILSHNAPRANACVSPEPAATTPKRPCPLRATPPKRASMRCCWWTRITTAPVPWRSERNIVAPVASAFPDLSIIPYVIPGRPAPSCFPKTWRLLFKHHPNVNTVKEATGNLDNMRRTRRCCGPEFTIFSGDDGLTMK
jgi:4-hydroxy-tetrahydrodipicolinate synthase